MNPLAVLTGYLLFGFAILLVSPLILVLAAADRLMGKGRRHSQGARWHHGRPHDARTAWDHEEEP